MGLSVEISFQGEQNSFLKANMKKIRTHYIRDGRAPTPRKESTSRVMRANKSKGTKPELTLRNILRRQGLVGARYNYKVIEGRPDIAYPARKIAIFVNGCFWHACTKCSTPPKTHKQFWAKKFERNKARDRRKINILRKAGWQVLAVWEHSIRQDTSKVVQSIEGLFRSS